MSETYVPTPRDAVIAYFGRNEAGNLRCYCVRCNEAAPLTEPSKIYGDLSYDTSDQCESCLASLLALSQACQREHDEQQARWARTSAPTVLIEYGIPAAIQCRVY